jgi:NitT/TauT family transport system substrate-binding protein
MAALLAVSLAIIGAAIFLSGLFASAQLAQSPQTIRLIGLPGVPLSVVAGSASGIFAKFGITVESRKATDASDLRNAIAHHSADVAHSAAENAVTMVDSGLDDVVLFVGGEISSSELIVQADIKTVKDLRGRVLITDGPDTAYTATLKKILSKNGLNPGTDYEIKVVGLAPQRLQAMIDHKEYAATIQKPPVSILSLRAGLVSLGTMQDLLAEGPSQGISGFADRKWAEQNREVLERYIAGFVQSQRWLTASENKPVVIALLSKESHLAPDVAAETYDAFLKHAWAKDARFDESAFKNTLALQSDERRDLPSSDKYYDSSYYSGALELLKTKP